MKKRILALLGLTSIALVASVVSLNSSKTAPTKVEEVFAADDPNTNWGGMKAVPFGDRYETTWTGEPKYSTQSPLQFSTMDIGDVWKNYQGFESGDKPVKVAVIDSGIDIYHEDFLTKEAKNVSITASNVKDYSILDPNSCYIHDTSNGYYSSSVVTDVGIDQAYDTDTYDSNYKEYYSHGTASAACIGAAINGAGGLGIAPKCELLIIRMDFYFTSLDKAIRYAADHGANVINMSLGAYAETFTDGYGVEQSGSSSVASALTSAINYALSKDCVVVAAAGNEKTNHKSYPACNAGVIGVGALASKSKTGAADFSNYNLDSDTSSTNNNVDVMAPGYVYTANMDASNGPKTGSNLKDSSYQNTQGTSFASPLTAGAIALARSKYPDMTHTEIEQRLFNTCSDIGNTGWDKKFGYGRVNISNLIGVTYEVEDITLNKTSINLYNNSTTTTLVADVLPETATNRLIHWSSSNTSVVTVPATSNAGAEITVTPKGVGTATITARSDFDNTILKQCSVTVSSYVSSEFTLSAPKTTIMEGETVQTSVAFTHENPTSTEILYDTSNSSVATVSDSGLVTGVGAGTATITAVSADDIQEITITVTLDPTKDSATIEFGDWPSGGTSGSGSTLSVTKSIFSMSLDKGYNSGSEIRNYANGTVTVSITNGTILSFSITLAGKDGGSLSVQSGGGSISRNSNIVTYTSGSTPSSSVKFKNGDQMRFTNTTIVYKSNIDPTVQYTVTFDGNGGSSPDSQTVASGTIITLPSSTRADYTFLGWSTSSSATSATYNGGASYTVESNVTLYAVWSSSGGGGGGGEITDLETTTYGFTDKNWSDSTSSWKSNSAGFGYDNSRGIQRTKGTCEGETKNSISNITKISIKAVTTSSGEGTYSIYVGATLVGSLPISKNTTLKDYEVYSGTPITGKVKINVNCSTNSIYIKSATITTGTSSGGGGGGDTPATNYTVSFNANGGSGNMSSATTTGSSYIVPACTFTRTDYTFSKWALNSASGTQYSVGSTITNITGNITLYAVWRSGSSGGVQMDPHYYDSITSDLTGTDLLSALRTLNLKKRTSTVGYSSMGTSPSGQFKYTDYDPTTVQYNSDGQPYGTKILSFYSGQSTTSFNREHVWPNSRGGGSVDSDIYMPRPTNQAENSNRGNSSYVEGMCHSANGWDPVTAFDSTLGTYSNIRGECARIIFYCTTANGSLSIKEGADLSYSNSIGNLSDLLKWNLQYPVNDREIRRQSGGQYLQGNRNAFVDDPSYACKIWGNTNAATRQVCGITDKNLTSITLSGNYKTQFEVGDNFSFGGTVTANYSNSSPADVTSKATYSGYDLSTAGNQTVTVSYTENNVTKTATYNITVTDSTPKVTGISLDYYSLQLDVIGTVTGTLNATVTGDAGADKTVSWSSSDTSVATVSATTGNQITVTGHKVGTATITASAGEHSITCSVSVIDSTPVVHSVTIASMPEKLDVTSNPTGEITLSIDADSGADASVTWDSSNKSVATVAPIVKSAKRSTGGIEVSATITAVGVGTTIISAEAGGKSASYELTVEDSTPHATGVTLDQTSVTLNIGDNITLTPTVSPSEAINKQVTWDSSTTSVATVDTSGVVRAVSVGSTTITVTTVDGGHTATCSVTVRSSSATVVRYELSPENSSVPYMTGKGSTTVNFTLYAIYSDNTRSAVETIEKSITTSSLGEKSINYTYNGTKYTSSVKVTNNGASIGDDSSFNATPAQQAEAWANYFINMTRTEDTCLASSDEDKLAGLQAVWSELSAEYGYMIANSKTAFCSSSASAKIKEALQHYQYIISKFNKDGVELTDFVVDGNNQKPASSSRSLLNTMFSFENSGFIVAILSIIGVASIAVFVVYKRRKMY